ncbi:hypothetical protein AUK22_07595 [bacterium CG2_30_54_10]|nr:MAG: hypothetical protein AUK22_07595 [bacterium CG2_30_54_10]
MPTPRQIERRQRVLRVSREFFAQQGFQETALDQVAQKAHIGKGIIYRYFGNKEDLLVADFADTFEAIQAAAPALPPSFPGTLEKRVRSIIRNYLRQIESQKETLAFFGKTLADLPCTPWGQTIRQGFIVTSQKRGHAPPFASRSEFARLNPRGRALCALRSAFTLPPTY